MRHEDQAFSTRRCSMVALWQTSSFLLGGKHMKANYLWQHLYLSLKSLNGLWRGNLRVIVVRNRAFEQNLCQGLSALSWGWTTGSRCSQCLLHVKPQARHSRGTICCVIAVIYTKCLLCSVLVSFAQSRHVYIREQMLKKKQVFKNLHLPPHALPFF